MVLVIMILYLAKECILLKTDGLTKTNRDVTKTLPKEIIDTYGKIQFY
jgi:hypothetical protein